MAQESNEITQDDCCSQNKPCATIKNSEGSTQEPVRLKRKVGLWNGIAIIIGVIIGTGIFISPGEVFKNSGSIGVSLLVWALCGLLSLMGALCMAELGTSIPDSGGDYSYIKLAYGPCMSFLYLWVTVLIILPCSNALAALTFARYVIQPFYDCEGSSDDGIRFIALLVILLLAWINCYSVDWSIKLQNAFTMAKLVALVIVILTGLYHLAAGHTDKVSIDNMWVGKALTMTGLASAFYSGLYSFAGWNALNFITEEIKDPVKNMPKAIIISITSITIIYIFVNFAYFTVLSPADILNSKAIAVTFGKQSLGWASFLMPVSVSLSTTSGLNALIFSSSRILFVGARQGQLFSLLNMISVRRLTPVPSLIVVAFMSSIYLASTNISELVNYLVFVEASFGALAVSTVLTLRHKFPEMSRPLRVNTCVPVLYLILSVLLILTPVFERPLGASIGTAILLTGVPVYYSTVRVDSKPLFYRNFMDKLTKFTQKLTVSVPQEEDQLEN